MSDIFSDFVAISRYCRWIPELGRRETWEEAVDRYFDYLEYRFKLFEEPDLIKAREMMKDRKLFGSMRALMTAGEALNKDDVASYNCSYVEAGTIESLRNIMYILMSGTGVGFSVERRCIDSLPIVPPTILKSEASILVQDSREGWAEAYYWFLNSLYAGTHPTVDTSLLRPAGARLKTFGGRSSGPEPFIRLIKFTASVLYAAVGRRLTPLEVHDIVCKIADCVVCGGVRRSALISLSDLADRDMATCKSGDWWNADSQRALSNNSAVYTNKPSMSQFISEWGSLYDSHSGERGVCNREAMTSIADTAGRDTNHSFGTNPCSEIILRPNQFCNLSTVVAKADDTEDSLTEKIRLATILGTIQSAMTDFSMFSRWGDSSWKKNCEEERLLGVSITGIFDCPLLSDTGDKRLTSRLSGLRYTATRVNREWSAKLGISPSKSVTCIKPEGTSSCVAGSSSGMHPRYSDYYIRRVRLSASDPLGQLMKDSGIPHEPCLNNPQTTDIFSFPIKSPTTAQTQQTIKPLDHLNLWLLYQVHYCDHKPSITVTYRDDDFLGIGSWLWENWDKVSGISFLPHSDHVYSQPPFEAITEDEYINMLQKMPISVDWGRLDLYEVIDKTENQQTLSCTAGGCELV